MSLDDSVAAWMEGLKQGDPDVVQEIWEQYCQRLALVACRILEKSARGPADEDDVVLSAYKSFCLRARDGKFPQLENRDDLWKLLVTITARKALKVRRKHLRVVRCDNVAQVQQRLEKIEPDPQVVAAFADELRRLIGLLDDEDAKSIVALKLEGYTNREIARKQERSISFVERRLRLVRQTWQGDMS